MSESLLSSVLPNNSIIDLMPGNPVSTVYAGNSNIKKVLELVQYNNDIQMSFPSPAFGATNTFMFPRTYQFLKNIIIRIDITHPNTNAAEIKEDYFAYHMIKEIKWTVGGTETFTINGDSFMHIIMSQCETQAKKNKLLDLAGAAQLPTANQSIRNKSISYYALLPFPWSSVESKKFGDMQYPLPIHMVNDPVQLQITFKPLAECCGVGTAINAAYLNFQYAKIASPNQLKATSYKYPWKSNFSFKYVKTATTPGVFSFDLSSFRKAELVGLSFHFVNIADYADGVGPYRSYSGEKLKNLQLIFNGQKVWTANDHNEIYELIYGKSENKLGERAIGMLGTADTTLESFDENQIKKTAVTASSSALGANYKVYSRGYANAILDGVSPFREKFYYYIPLTEIKDFSQNYSLGADISKQSMSLSFVAPTAVAETGTLFITYHYSSIYTFNGDNVMLVF